MNTKDDGRALREPALVNEAPSGLRPSGFDPARIDEALAGIERQYKAKIIIAVESGSRAWGFPSPDSDYDVRFIYARPVEFYIQVRERRDVIEVSDGLLDMSGWDVRKAIGLIMKSNASAVEWLRSPTVYREAPEAELLRAFAANVSVGGVQRHYYYLARSIWRERFAGGRLVSLKKYFYLIRPALALRHIRLHGSLPPMDLPSLVAQTAIPDGIGQTIADLVERKKVTREVGGETRLSAVDAFCCAEIEAAGEGLKDFPPPTEAAYDEADSLMRRLIGLHRDSDTRRMAETAKQGSVRSTGSAGRKASPDIAQGEQP